MSRTKSYEQLLMKKAFDREDRPLQKYIRPAAILLLFLFTGIVLSLTVSADFKSSPGKMVTKDNLSDILQQMSGELSEDVPFEVIMTSAWTFETGSSVSKDAYVKNSANNQNTIYFTVELTDDKLPVYLSPRLAVGDSVSDIRLNTSLEPGTYEAVLTYYLLDQNETCVSTIPIKVKITVNN